MEKESHSITKTRARTASGQKSRYNQTMAALARVLQNPEHSLYKKSDLAGHCAADVGQQYRLFFFIEHDHNVINFVWLNDEYYIHTTDGPKDHCYEQFKKLIRDEVIKKYIHMEPKVPSFIMDGKFEDSYISFKCLLDKDGAFSSASLSLDQDDEIRSLAQEKSVYLINSINAKNEKHEINEILLKWMCEEADKSKIFFSMYLVKYQTDYEEMKILLLSNGFNLISNESEDVYLRKNP